MLKQQRRPVQGGAFFLCLAWPIAFFPRLCYHIHPEKAVGP